MVHQSFKSGLKLVVFFLLFRLPVYPELNADNLVEFNIHYGRLSRDYFGCAANAVDMTECHPGQGIANYREYRAARSAAAKLFDLQERP